MTLTYEGLAILGGETVSDYDEIIKSREEFFAPATLDANDIFCGDERDPDTSETYLHVFGGVLGPVFNLTVMKEITQPGSVSTSFENETRTLAPLINRIAHVRGGVHSDDHAELGAVLRTDVIDGPVGCGYAGLRKEISQTIVQKQAPIISRAAELLPELFESDEDAAFAHQVINAHERLINRPGFITTGRRVVLAAAEQGAKTMLVRGKHTGKTGIINLMPNSTLRSGDALRANLSSYDQDAWATQEINNRLRDLYPYDAKQQKIAETLDTIGTLLALGVDLADIAVRRPAA